MNVWIILTLIILVAGFNMVSGLLILYFGTNIHDRYPQSNRKQQLQHQEGISLSLLLFNRTWNVVGNIAGIGICLLQSYFSIFRLDLTSYYLNMCRLI